MHRLFVVIAAGICLAGFAAVPKIILPLAGTALAQPVDAEKQAFEAAKDLGIVEAWDAFLANYPTGFHADLARAYVKKLAGATPPPGPAPAPSQSAANLPPAQEVTCGKATKVRSELSKEPATIRFINQSDATLIIQWIDFKGALKEYGELQPGAELTQETFVSHPWIAAYQEGSCRQLFLPLPGASVARLLPEEQLPGSRKGDNDDRGSTPEQSKKSAQPSKATIERRAKAACVDMGMIYLNGKCAPKTKAERDRRTKNKNKACPAGLYRNSYGQCQPNETGG